MIDDRRGDDAIAGNEIWRQAASDAEADDAAAAGLDGELQQVGHFVAAADHKRAGTGRDSRLESQPDQRNHRTLRQIGKFRRTVAIGQRPDRGCAAPVDVDIRAARPRTGKFACHN